MPAPGDDGHGLDRLAGHDDFHARHLGPTPADQAAMLALLGVGSIDALIAQTVPPALRLDRAPAIEPPVAEHEALAELQALADRNERWRSFIGTGYANTRLPEPIRRYVLENPGWYTAYTPYQAEIAQGRLEALLTFQQVTIDLTGLPVAVASLLDEASAAAEAMGVIRRAVRGPGGRDAARFFVDEAVHPQVLAVLRTRAHWMGIAIVTGPTDALPAAAGEVFGAYLQNPDTFGRVRDLAPTIAAVHAAGGRVAVGTDLLALMLVEPPGAMGADLAVGSAQRFGVPMGYGGPHAAFMGAKADLVRLLPGRIIGVSKDAAGHIAYRMSLQTREQHIRRDKATSNICTAQALLAMMAAFYAVWHGPAGLRRIALRTHGMARLLVELATDADPRLVRPAMPWFDTVAFDLGDRRDEAIARAASRRINLRRHDDPGGTASGRLGVAFDETTGLADVADVVWALTGQVVEVAPRARSMLASPEALPAALRRTDEVLSHPVFHGKHTEAEFVRWLERLRSRDLSLVHAMIPLGSCTMKLNAAAEMAPVSWPGFADLHPYVPPEQAVGYTVMLDRLARWLAEITGFDAVSFQPNSGAQGEYAGLLAIRRYQAARGEGARDVCLIPSSAHGTNPATASMMGLQVVMVACDARGDIDAADLEARLAAHGARTCALMITYPSTHGVFEEGIAEICAKVHAAGGQVYMDGANLNAQAGLTSPARIGADVCHLNLHKTFCIPHGGGGPGMGPIAVAAHLKPFLPAHPLHGDAGGDPAAVSSAPFGSALITTIPWMYVRMMGGEGIRRATELAILNANYLAARLAGHYPVVYAGRQGRVAHECIVDLRPLKAQTGISAEDVAKRLIDYGFHAPTLSWPVPDTLMVEPTESESKAEIDRFCDAMIAIRAEIEQVRTGAWPRDDNPLKNAPHTAAALLGEWTRPYGREQAAYPLPWLRDAKFWPAVARIDNAAGDRHLVCGCPPPEAWQ